MGQMCCVDVVGFRGSFLLISLVFLWEVGKKKDAGEILTI